MEVMALPSDGGNGRRGSSFSSERRHANEALMKSTVRGLAAIGATLALTSACGGYTVSYDGARAAKRAKSDVIFYEIDCRDPVTQPADCIYSGAPLPWQVIGAFRVPKKAVSGWEGYRKKLADSAAANGCPAVAVRKFAPATSDGNAIGAFCVNPAPANAGNAGPGPGTGVGVSVSATVTATVTECNANSDCPPGQKCARGACSP
jgi:hypothetical protein